jgi:uncharacterized protein YabN with tetrapyrrole methylase and pyrophosphatase domain
MKTQKDVDDIWKEIKKYEDALKRKQDELTELIKVLKPKALNIPCVIVSVCDDWIHDERVKCNDDNYCPICGKNIKAN